MVRRSIRTIVNAPRRPLAHREDIWANLRKASEKELLPMPGVVYEELLKRGVPSDSIEVRLVALLTGILCVGYAHRISFGAPSTV